MSKVYTNKELREFEAELKPFRVKKTLRDGYKAEYTDIEAYAVSKRIMKIPHGYHSASIIESRIKDYEELMEKWDQLKALKRKTAFAKEQEAKALEESAV